MARQSQRLAVSRETEIQARLTNDEEEYTQSKTLILCRKLTNSVRLFVGVVVERSEFLLSSESVSGSNGRDDLFGEGRTSTSSSELFRLGVGNEFVHGSSGDSDTRNDSRDNECEPPVSNDGDDETGEEGTHEERRHRYFVTDCFLNQVRIGFNASSELSSTNLVEPADL